ncbi:MAG: GDCCVxC domain-containing (seleno)protein [Pseudomonadota bacterium]
MAEIITVSTLSCPHCGHSQQASMPVDACQFFYECIQCKTLLRPKAGDCCVFCSYGSVKCPPMQVQGGTCCVRGTPG